MKKILTILFTCTSIFLSAQTCPTEDITFTTQQQIDDFPTDYPGCTDMPFSITISGPDISNLSGLNQLVSVGGNLNIGYNPSLTSLSGLAALTTVGGGFDILGNPLITSLSGLSALTTIGDYLTIYDNPFLVSLSGLNALTTVGGDLAIDSNTSLASLSALSALNSIGGYLTIYGNNSLVNLSGLDAITTVASCDISNNNSLTSLSALSALTSIIGNLNISGNNLLVDLSGLGALTTIGGGLIITNNSSLTSLTGLDALTSIDYANIGDNSSLVNLSGLGALTTVNDISITNNASLTSLTGLGALASMGSHLYIAENNSLANLSGLDALTTVGGDLSIDSNGSLASLSALSALTSIGGSNIYINQNSLLTSLTGLDNLDLAPISYMELRNNPLLSVCDLTNICTYLSDPANSADISNNATGCATRTEVEIACDPAVCPSGDLTFTTQQQVDNFSTNYPGCTVMPYSIAINGAGITNLNGLSQLAAINGDISITGTALTNLSGLGALTSLGGSFSVSNNAALTTLAGIGPITGVDWLFISENIALTNLNGLNMVGSVAGNMNIFSNPVLVALTGLSALTSVGGDVYIFGNNALTNLSGLNALANISGDLNVYSNPSMTHLTGLNALTSVSGKVDILYMTIISLAGLNSLNSIGGNLNISYTAIENMTGLGSLTNLGGNLTLNYNGSLANVTALAALTTIGGALTISNNGALPSLNGLHNVAAGSITSLVLTDNSLLSVCDLANICEYLSEPTNPATISGNATGCATRPQVQAACNSGTYTFTGAGGAGWSVAASWAGGVVPPDPLPIGEEIVIAANCTRNWYTTINGTITINSGVTLTIYQAAEELTFTINGTGHNYGTVNATEESLVTGTMGSFTNYSGASVQAVSTLGGIVNNGQFTNQAGAATNIWAAGNSGVFTNAGTVIIGFIWTNLSGGVLSNSGSFTNSANSGVLNNTAGATINLTGGTISLSCGIANNGSINQSGGDVHLLRNPVQWPSNFNWTGGTVTIGGSLDIDAGNTITVPAGGTLFRTNGQPLTINNGGSLVVNGMFTPQSGNFTVQNGGNFSIGAGATIAFSSAALNNSGTLINAGTLNLEQSSGELLNNGSFVNTGTVNVYRILKNSGSMSNIGVINLFSNGILELDTDPAELPGGTFNWNNGGILRIGVNGRFTLDNTFTVPASGTLIVLSSAPFTILPGAQLINNGTINLSSTSVNDGTLTNYGSITLHTGSLTNNGTLTNMGNLILRTLFVNNGTLHQNDGSLYQCAAGVPLLPGGTFNWNGGLLHVGHPSYPVATTLDAPFVLPSNRFLYINTASSLTNNSSMTISPSSTFVVWGNLINNDQIENNGIISPLGGSIFTNNGLIKGEGNHQGSLGFTNGPNGTIAPGSSPGCYGFFQGLTNQGTLSMEINGPTPCTQHDYLTNSGTTTLGGTLQLTFGFVPLAGQSFTLLFSTSIAGSFSTINVTPNNITVSQSGATITVTGVLPVELVEFSAQKIDQSVLLNWQTASETDNRGFEVQRSADGARWQEIGFVNGYGTTTTPQHYTLLDKEPLGSINYYRLRQIDFDGTANLSNIVAVKGSDKHSELKLNPNPAAAIVEIKGVDLTSEPLLKIIDATGRPLLEQRLNSSTLDVSALPPGIYHLVLYDSKGAFRTGRLVRQ